MLSETKKIGKIDSTNLAEYILSKYGAMSHLKLQKLLYFVQGYHLAYFSEPIIDDEFEAWVHGPVSRKIYNEVRDFSILYNEIGYTQKAGEVHPQEIIEKELTGDQKEILNATLDEFSKLKGIELENETHSHAPWIKARTGYSSADKCSVVIPKEEIRSYFKAALYEN